jgi:hypothetical protein
MGDAPDCYNHINFASSDTHGSSYVFGTLPEYISSAKTGIEVSWGTLYRSG